MSFWGLRHPPIARDGRCIGQTVMQPTVSIAEAVRTAMTNRPMTPLQIVSSDQPRCAMLAHALGEAMGVSVFLFDDLREMNFGEWEGISFDDLDRFDRQRWRAWCENWQHDTPPGGESLATLEMRVSKWLDQHRPKENTLVVTHAGVLRAFQVLGGSSWDSAMQTPYGYLEWHQFQGRRP